MNESRPSVATTHSDTRNVDARNSGNTALATIGLTVGLLAFAVVTLPACGQRGPLILPGSPSVPSAAPPASSPTPTP